MSIIMGADKMTSAKLTEEQLRMMSSNDSATVLKETNEEYVQGVVALLAEERDKMLYATTGSEEDTAAQEIKGADEAMKAVLKKVPPLDANKAPAVVALLHSEHAMKFMMRVIPARSALVHHRIWNMQKLNTHLHGVYGAVSAVFLVLRTCTFADDTNEHLR